MQLILDASRVESMAHESKLVIYTIGHSNVSMDRFLELLESCAIETVIDIRTRPFSSYVPHFNRPNIEQALRREGVEYVFMGDVLGGYPRDPDCYIYNVARNKRIPDYEVMAGKDWFKDGLRTAIEVAQHKKAVLMCSEEDPGKCHRHCLVSKSLAEDGVKVIHIRANGNLESADFGNSHADDRGKDVDKGVAENQPHMTGDLFSSGNVNSHIADHSKPPKEYGQLSLFDVEDWDT